MLHKASFLVCLLALMVDRSSEHRPSYYTVVAPGSVRTNTPYHVSVSLGDLKKAALFNISLTDKSRLNIHTTVAVQPGTTELISIPVPKLQFGYATLTVVVKGILSRKSAIVLTEDHNYQIYIQTDKPRYRPGDLVRFRVICIDELTRPAVTDDVLDVLIYDDDGNLVKKVENIKLTRGVFKGQMQLAHRTPSGVWKIRVQSNSSQAEEKSFRVSSYVLPRVTLDTDSKSAEPVDDKESQKQIWIQQATHFKGNASSTSAFILNILTPSAEVGEEIIVQLTSLDPIDHFVYEIVSRGNIIQAERINIPEEATTHQFRINTTHAMVPKISLYVHRAKGGIFESALKEIYIARTFQNSIEISVEGESRPGASVPVNVSTEEDSYVGLMAVDQRVLDNEMEEDLSQDRVFSRLTEYDASTLNEDVDPGSEAGLITLSNCFKANKHKGNELDHGPMMKRTIHERSRARRVFSDGWLFDDFESTPRGGLQLHPTIPDAIASWAITGFSLNPRTGLSLTKRAATLRVFQSVFISMDLPSVVREGEILEVPVYVFNYNNEVALTVVTAECQGEHLVLLDSLSKDGSPSFKMTFSVSISARGRVRLTFPIKALKTGLFNVTVRATSPVGSDALQKTLTVVSEGIPHLVSRSHLVHFLQESEQADELVVHIPEDVQGSEQIELSVVGDTFGPLMESLSNLVQVPYGNGKEKTKHFISNLLALQYLKVFNLENPSLERRALLFLETGYEALLKLKHPDGSFSFFKRSTKSTDNALQTAIVMWALQQAKSFIQVDHNLLTACSNFLKRKQAPNGGFRSGTGLDDDVTLTTVALLALIEDGGNANVISRGLAFLYNSLADLHSPTSAALSKYVLVMGRHEKSQEILSQLSSRSARIREIPVNPHSIGTGRRVLWDRSTTIQGVLEATSGSFLSILQSQAKPTDTLMPIVTALLSPGHSDKIPTHLMALDAMIRVARDMRFGTRNLHIHFESDQGDAGDLEVNSSNMHVLQTVQLDSATRKVRIATKGQGLAVVTVKSRYNRPREHLTTSTFQTNVTVSEGAEALVDLKICVSTRLAGGTGNLTEVEVNLPSGYTVLEDQEDNPFNSHLGKYEADRWADATGISPKLRAFKVDSGAGSVHAIFEDIDRIGACFNLSTVRAFRVLNAKVVSVVVHDVYDEGQRSTTLHQLDMMEETG